MNRSFKLIGILRSSLLSDVTQSEVDEVAEAAFENLTAITKLTVARDDTGLFLRQLIDTCAEGLRAIPITNRRDTEAALWVLSAMEKASVRLIERGDPHSIGTVVVARELAERALDSLALAAGNDEVIFRHTIPGFARIMGAIGAAAIKSNSELLYRCLDGLGWLGCSAALRDEDLLGRESMNYLVQLGRLARASSLECFWTKCALQPHDHADERLFLIDSWLPELPPDSRSHWTRSFVEAVSRLRGTDDESDWVEKEGKPSLKIRDMGEPHRTGYMSSEGSRTLDYSDPSMTKNLELW